MKIFFSKVVKTIIITSTSIILLSPALSLAANKHINKIPVYLNPPHSSISADSPAIKTGKLVFISGQGAASIQKAFQNLSLVARAAGGNINDIVKINVYLTDLSDYAALNKVMKKYFKKPYPARSTVGIAALPHHHKIEIDAVMAVNK